MACPRRHDRWTDPRLVTVGLLVAALVPRLSGRPRKPPLGLDKLAHAVAHALFVYSLLTSVDTTSDRNAVPAVVGLSVAYAFLLESLQRYVPGRQFETGDIVASLVGSVVGVVLVRRQSSTSTPGTRYRESAAKSSTQTRCADHTVWSLVVGISRG